MAMFEKEGYCPSNAFLQYEAFGDASPFRKRAQEILGDRTGYMVYTEGGNSYKGGFIVDALAGGDGTMGIEIATALKVLIPTCEYAKSGKKILCTDIINPFVIPAGIIEEGGKWICTDMNDKTTFLFEDNRYLVAIQDHDELVRVYIYKK